MRLAGRNRTKIPVEWGVILQSSNVLLQNESFRCSRQTLRLRLNGHVEELIFLLSFEFATYKLKIPTAPLSHKPERLTDGRLR